MKESALENFVNNKASELMSGGGYSINPNEQIAGMATVDGYDDVAIHNIANPSMDGGAKHKKHTKSSRKSKKGGKKTKKRSLKSKSKKRSGSKKRGGSMKGGMGDYPFDGMMSDHSPSQMTKDFGGHQPLWAPNTR